MDFQTQQREAKKNTTKLVALLMLGLLAIIAVVTLLLIFVFYYSTSEVDPLAAVAVAAPLTTVGVVGTSLVKSSQIKGGGGSYVATSMGGRPVDFNTMDPAEKQLSNVVEEIAIASGMPVPAVFVLDNEPGINAFAAGWTADNAAIGVTRGALQQLNRRELQGVIAHEFSHIRNGDTRVKTRIIGWVFGIAVITVLGRILLEHMWWAPRRRNSKDNSTLVILAVGIGLVIIGSVGTLFARMVQAAVSRQREYLADASAVQYTRDPSGIGDALMKIGGMGTDNKVRAAHATEAGHLFFSSALGSALATHPPLKARIRRLVPEWDGAFRAPQAMTPTTGDRGATTSPPGRWGGALPGQVLLPGMPDFGLPVDPAILAVGGATAASSLAGDFPAPQDLSGPRSYQAPSFGGPTDEHIAHARTLLARIPEATQNYLHTRQGAVAAVLGLLVSVDPAVRDSQLAYAASVTNLDPDYFLAASDVISRLDRPLQLPAIDLALHSIRETPYEFRQTFGQTIRTLERTRPDQDLFRWTLRHVMLRHLEDQHDDGSVRHDQRFETLHAEASLVFAVIAWFNSAGPAQAQGAFDAAQSASGAVTTRLPAIDELAVAVVDTALERLARLDQTGRERFVTGATAAVMFDGTATADEAELIRVVADAVRMPVPPLLPV